MPFRRQQKHVIAFGCPFQVRDSGARGTGQAAPPSALLVSFSLWIYFNVFGTRRRPPNVCTHHFAQLFRALSNPNLGTMRNDSLPELLIAKSTTVIQHQGYHEEEIPRAQLPCLHEEFWEGVSAFLQMSVFLFVAVPAWRHELTIYYGFICMFVNCV